MSNEGKIAKAQDKMLADWQSAQERMIEMNQRMAQAIGGVIPSDSVQLPSIPGMAEMPAASEMVDSYFDFMGKMAEANRTFYKSMIDVWAPVESDLDDTKSPKAAKKAPKAKASTKTKASA